MLSWATRAAQSGQAHLFTGAMPHLAPGIAWQKGTEMSRDLLEMAFIAKPQTGGEFVLDGYNGEFGHVYVEVKKPISRKRLDVASCELSESQVRELHAYLTAWLEKRGEQ